jgi:hypothetical protein
MSQPSSALALEVYAKKMERERDTGARMDALIRAADWAQTATASWKRCRCRKQKRPLSSLFPVGGTGLEPVTSCL